MEGLGFAVGLGVLFGVSTHAGRHWTNSTFQAILFGIAAGLASAVAAAATSFVVYAWDASQIGADMLGLKLLFLMVAGPAIGAAWTIRTHRRMSPASEAGNVVSARIRALDKSRAGPSA